MKLLKLPAPSKTPKFLFKFQTWLNKKKSSAISNGHF